MRYLFIGGSHDGERVSVESDLQILRMPKMRTHTWTAYDDTEPTITIENDIYQKERLRDMDGAEYTVYRSVDCTLCTIAALINGYGLNR